MAAENGNGIKVKVGALANVAIAIFVGWMAYTINSNSDVLAQVSQDIAAMKVSIVGGKERLSDHIRYDRLEHETADSRLRSVESAHHGD